MIIKTIRNGHVYDDFLRNRVTLKVEFKNPLMAPVWVKFDHNTNQLYYFNEETGDKTEDVGIDLAEEILTYLKKYLGVK